MLSEISIAFFNSKKMNCKTLASVWIILFFFAFASCSQRKDNYEAMLGEWSNVSLTLRQTTVNNGARDSTLLIEAGQWAATLGMNPIRTTYAGNGGYVSRYYNLHDSLVFESEGSWYVIGDSVYLGSEEGVTSYFFEPLGNGKARFVSLLDWDGDGKRDDLYDGIQQKK